MIFDWNENKEKLNIKNHDGIDFNEASEAFYDDNAFEFLTQSIQLLKRKDLFVSETQVKDCCGFHTRFALTLKETK